MFCVDRILSAVRGFLRRSLRYLRQSPLHFSPLQTHLRFANDRFCPPYRSANDFAYLEKNQTCYFFPVVLLLRFLSLAKTPRVFFSTCLVGNLELPQHSASEFEKPSQRSQTGQAFFLAGGEISCRWRSAIMNGGKAGPGIRSLLFLLAELLSPPLPVQVIPESLLLICCLSPRLQYSLSQILIHRKCSAEAVCAVLMSLRREGAEFEPRLM